MVLIPVLLVGALSGSEASPQVAADSATAPSARQVSPDDFPLERDAAPRTTPCDPCDGNCDALHNDLDVEMFVNALIHGTAGCDPCFADMDDSGVIDGLDVRLFISCMLQSPPSVTVVKNGTIFPNPLYPYLMESYNEGDLPALRAFASTAGIFDGIDMNADWKDREWNMIRAIQAWLVRNARTSAVGNNSRHDVSARAITYLTDLASGGRIVAWGQEDRYGNVAGAMARGSDSGFLAIAAGLHHSLALRRSGVIDAWGRNQFGQADEPSPNEDFIAIAAGENHNLALTKDGRIVAWGNNASGQCNVPEQNADFVAISAGIEFSLGLRNDGSTAVWGSLPTDVALNPAWQGHFVKAVAGGYHCVGLLDDGRVVAWGANGNNQCVVPTQWGSTQLQGRILDIGADKRRSYATVDFGIGVIYWGLSINTSYLTGGRFRSLWAGPAQKYLLASRDTVPDIQGAIDKPVPAPAASLQTALAYDSDREVIIKFGGRTAASGGSNLNETFEWNGHEWDGQTPALKPSTRSEHCMAYDPLRQRTILWGQGSSSGGGNGNAWEWNGTTWAGPYAASGASRPAAFLGCRALWDPDRGSSPQGRVTMFFGRSASTVFETAYDYDPVTHTFTERIIGGSPGARYAFGLAYDSDRDRIILFGGADAAHLATNDTREASAGGTGTTTFTLVTPETTTPAPRYEHAMVYDAARNRVVMFGGRDGTTYFDETWEWDGEDWTLRSPTISPGQRAGHDMIYDAKRQAVVLFGGHRNDGPNPGTMNDTWEWDGSDWKQLNLTIIPSGVIPDVSDTDFAYVGYAAGADFGLGLIDYVWSCGLMRQMFAGLCVAHGIPARRMSGRDLNCRGDMLVEAYSTRWNKWVLFFQYTGNWVENADGVPLSHAELRAHHDAADYRLDVGYDLAIGRRGWRAFPVNDSGLVFKPMSYCTSPIAPFGETRWWADTLKVNPVSPADDHDHFDRNITTSSSKDNRPNPQNSTILLDDHTDIDEICETNLSSRPLSYVGDPNITYPINNVRAEAELVGSAPLKVRITLTHNMVAGTGGFDHYEMSLDDGETWSTMSLEFAGPGAYNWYPTETGTLSIRGVNAAGVHSPDVVIRFDDGSP